MKRMAFITAFGTFFFLAACSADGLIFNGLVPDNQIKFRNAPIPHYQLPGEGPPGGIPELDFDLMDVNITDFGEAPSGAFVDRWAVAFDFGRPPQLPSEGLWHYFLGIETIELPSGGANPWPWPADWPHPQVQMDPLEKVAAWMLSLMNQWFLRDVDGSELPGQVTYDGLMFSSMAISIHDSEQVTTGFSPALAQDPPRAFQQEATDQTPVISNLNGRMQVNPPLNNVLGISEDGHGAPAGLMGLAWIESPGQNVFIETSLAWAGEGPGEPYGNIEVAMSAVPAPAYNPQGGVISGRGGGVYLWRYVNTWVIATLGPNTTFDVGADGMYFAYYLAGIFNHLIGYGVGLRNSSFLAMDGGGPGPLNEDIMSDKVIIDTSFVLAPGHFLQFVSEDLGVMQDTATPANSTLPGAFRGP